MAAVVDDIPVEEIPENVEEESTGAGDLPDDPYLLPETKERGPNGGCLFTNTIQVKAQRRYIWEFVKGIGGSILEGYDLTRISMPVRLFEPRSFLERMTIAWAFAPHFLNRAADCSDPVERLKNVVAFAISGLHLTLSGWKPFNPILGETFQATMEDGINVECEQTSHHPPISHWIMTGPGGKFSYYGYGEWSAAFRGNHLKGGQVGLNAMSFPDGTKITWNLPSVIIKGVLWGERIMDYAGSMKFVDQKNDLTCEITFNPDDPGFFKGLFSKAASLSDSFRGEIYSTSSASPSSGGFWGRSSSSSKKSVLAQLSGSWLSHIDVDGNRFWSVDMAKSATIPTSTPLPSDCRFREDLQFLSKRDFENAQKWKQTLEDRQRTDRALRKKAGKGSH